MEETDSLPVGSRIEVTLRPDSAAEFAKKDKVVEVINKYSYFITLPITVNGERVNTVDAIWTMNPKEVTSEMHDTFFRQLAKTHSPHLASDRPQYTIHYKVARFYLISNLSDSQTFVMVLHANVAHVSLRPYKNYIS